MRSHTIYTIEEVRDVLSAAEQVGYITSDQSAQIAGLFIAQSMIRKSDTCPGCEVEVDA